MKSRFKSEGVAILLTALLLFLFDFLFLNEVIRWFSRALFVETTPMKAVLFFFSYIFMIFAIAVMLLSKYIRFPVFFGSVFMIAIGKLYFSINGEAFGVLDIETALRYLDFTSQAVSTYWKAGLVSIWPIIPYAILFLFIHKNFEPISLKYSPLILVGLLVGASLTARSAGSHTRAFPRYIQPLFVGGYYMTTRPYVGPRDQPYFKPASRSVAKHIIFIMDESVRGDLLSINGHDVDTTPELLKSKNKIFNFGIASSLSNSSSSSNYGVLTGVKMKDLPDKKQISRRLPLLFTYAHNSVERNVNFVWGQTSFVAQKQKFEFLNENVFDLYTANPNLPVYEYDRKIIEKLVEITAGDTNTFTWVNKWGSHFDYDTTYPSEKEIFKPVYKNSSPDDQTALYNSYYNSLRWGVDGFLSELLKRLDNRDVIVVYSADHGQSLLEAGIPGTHNRTYNVSATQASVPLLAMGFNTTTRDFLKSHFNSEIRDKVSAEQIFPTLLYLLGYAKSDIEKHYAPTLFDFVSGKSRTFLSGDMWGFGPAVSNPFLWPQRILSSEKLQSQ